MMLPPSLTPPPPPLLPPFQNTTTTTTITTSRHAQRTDGTAASSSSSALSTHPNRRATTRSRRPSATTTTTGSAGTARRSPPPPYTKPASTAPHKIKSVLTSFLMCAHLKLHEYYSAFYEQHKQMHGWNPIRQCLVTPAQSRANVARESGNEVPEALYQTWECSGDISQVWLFDGVLPTTVSYYMDVARNCLSDSVHCPEDYDEHDAGRHFCESFRLICIFELIAPPGCSNLVTHCRQDFEHHNTIVAEGKLHRCPEQMRTS
ncbi:hypothetical protein T492DRAFT_849551 [Pavlovales sp. CCMP2436]|nr:hypothetical protein T492DRAFT_849551 [Pavlovales sp. CCMP2436]